MIVGDNYTELAKRHYGTPEWVIEGPDERSCYLADCTIVLERSDDGWEGSVVWGYSATDVFDEPIGVWVDAQVARREAFRYVLEAFAQGLRDEDRVMADYMADTGGGYDG